ncbi:alpha/beta-hydrolase [Rhizopogon vinicolor AM-OR11-026]|uniref:Alpha/beta-hydrolase n=1 Tax=Rhizopogon vinicolor AM-OR11-026 TaxID=1314800 RepID=A0A1B7MKN0_9AGAM|nr:alpha/beta-hydrolase [Rhizopogon vinicolor AM-OR11-026]
MFEYRTQPWKTLYLAYTILSIAFIRLPFWFVISALPWYCPRRSWNMTRTIVTWGMQAFVSSIFAVGAFDHANPEKEIKNVELGLVWVEGVPTDFIRGDIASIAEANSVAPARIHGYWCGKRDAIGNPGQSASPGEKVLYYLHGGCYVMSSGSPKAVGGVIIRDILKHGAEVFDRAFSLDYRLASAAPFEAANAFPAQLIDALSGFHYLTKTLGFAPENIIVVGDSAGGHLVITLTRYLARESFPSLRSPRGIILLAPSCDWACTHDASPTASMKINASADFCGMFFTSGYTAAALRGTFPEDEVSSNAWYSPASLKIDTVGLFSNFPPTCIIAGGADQTVDGMRTFRDRLLVDNEPGKVLYSEYPDGFHDFLFATFHEPERTQALEEIADWVKGLF